MFRDQEQRIHTVEQPDLPSWLIQRAGKLWYRDKSVAEEKSGPWDYVVSFGASLEALREPLGVKEKRNNFASQVVWNEDLSWGIISKHARNLTLLANAFSLDHPDVQLIYTANFMALFRKPLEQGINYVGKDTIVLAPERGAGVIKLMLAAYGFKPEQMTKYQASRNILDRNYTVALRFDAPLRRGSKVIHLDDCGAAGGTEWAGLAIYELLHGTPEAYASVIGVGVRRAVTKRAEELAAREINFRIFVGAESHLMNSHYYLALTPEERHILALSNDHTFRVGDMGIAMELDSPARQADLPYLQQLAGTSDWDQEILDLTAAVVDDPNLLPSQAQRLRQSLI